jgi:ubiquinol-cytochrome c reductase iron-sulfur subunit
MIARGNLPSVSDRATGTVLVLMGFTISVLGGIGFLVAYWTNSSNMVLGGSLALCFLGFGCALIFWSHRLMRQKEVSAPRELLPSDPQEYEALFEEFYPREPNIHRRKLLVGMSTVVGTTVIAAWVSVFRSFFGSSPYGAPLASRIWTRGQRLITDTGEIASIHSLKPGGSVIVFPEDLYGYVSAQTILLRVPEQYLRLPKGRADWAPMGYLAYSRVCTHAGCPVGLFEAENDLLLCPCHQSTFNVLDGAEPTGGPAARPLPQLPLYVDRDGNLRAGGGFTAPPGPGYWSMPS